MDALSTAAAACLAVFVASTDKLGQELYVTDGKPGGPQLLKDIYPGEEDGLGYDLTPYRGDVVFTAEDRGHGRELWRSDGTPEGTRLVKDLLPGAGSYGIKGADDGRFPSFGGKLLFQTKNSSTSDRIAYWVTDGTTAGTKEIASISSKSSPSTSILATNGDLAVLHIFRAGGSSDLWALDAKTKKLTRIFDLKPYYKPTLGNPGTIKAVAFGRGRVAVGVGTYSTIDTVIVTDGTEDGSKVLKGTGRIADFSSAVGVYDLILLRDLDNTLVAMKGNGREAVPLITGLDLFGHDPVVRVGRHGGQTYFTLHDTGTHDGLWVTEGTEKTTRRVFKFDDSSGEATVSAQGDELLVLADAASGRNPGLAVFRAVRKPPVFTAKGSFGESYGGVILGRRIITHGTSPRGGLPSIDMKSGKQTTLFPDFDGLIPPTSPFAYGVSGGDDPRCR